MVKVKHKFKDLEKNPFELTSKLHRINVDGEKENEDLKLMLDNHIKFFKVLLYDNDKYMTTIDELK